MTRRKKPGAYDGANGFLRDLTEEERMNIWHLSKRMESLGPEMPDCWLEAGQEVLDMPIPVRWPEEEDMSAHGEINYAF